MEGRVVENFVYVPPVVVGYLPHEVGGQDGRYEQVEQEDHQPLPDGRQRENEGLYQFLQPFEALDHPKQPGDPHDSEYPGYLGQDRQGRGALVAGPAELQDYVEHGGRHHEEVEDIPAREEVVESEHQQLQQQFADEDVAEDGVEGGEGVEGGLGNVVVGDGHDDYVGDDYDGHEDLEVPAGDDFEEGLSDLVGGREVEGEAGVLRHDQLLEIFPVDLLVGKGLGPDLGLGLVVVHEHDAHQQVHEEEGPDEYEQHREQEIHYLAIVLDRPRLGPVDEGVYVEGPVLPGREDVEGEHGVGNVLEVNEVGGPGPSRGLAGSLVGVVGAVLAGHELATPCVAEVEFALEQVHAQDGEHEEYAEADDKDVENAQEGFRQGGDHYLHLLVSGDYPERSEGPQQFED